MSSRHHRSGVASLTLVTGVLASGAAYADQFVALDETWEHTADLPDSHYRVDPSPETPADWTTPVDYTDGTAWVYLEVQTKPTTQETKFQVCFEATPTYACTAQSPTYTTVGTYEWPTKFSDFWSPPNEFVDWSQGVNKLANILKDTQNNKPSADNVGATEAALYMPTHVRMVVTIVSAGGTYVPPTPTGSGGVSGAAGAGGTPPTGGGGTATGGGGAGGSGGATSDGGSTSNGGTSDGGAGKSGVAPPENDEGCGVSSRRLGSSRGWLALVALGLIAARRRRVL